MRPILRNLIPGPRPNSIFHGRLRLWLTPPPFRLWYAAIRTGIKHTTQGRSNGLGLRTHLCSRIRLMCLNIPIITHPPISIVLHRHQTFKITTQSIFSSHHGGHQSHLAVTNVVRVVVVGASHTLSHSPRQICQHDQYDDNTEYMPKGEVI